MKTALWILSIALLVSLLVNFDTCSRLRDADLTAEAIRSVWKADKAISEKESEVWEKKVDSLENRQTRRDSVHTFNNASQKKVIARLIRKERQNRLDSTIQLPQDTIYLLAGNLVDSLENQIQELKTVDSMKSALHDKQLEIQEKLIQTCDSLMGEIKIPAKPSLISFGGSVGPGIVFGPSGTVHGGFGATIGMNIKIPIKIRLRDLFRRK